MLTSLDRSEKDPAITVTCECGQRRDLKYGERWQCESCGRRFDTRKIPLEQYAAVRRTQIRYRLFPLISSVVLFGAVIAFWIAGRAFTGVIAVAFLAASWSLFGRPFYRTKYRTAISKNVPTWTIKSDGRSPPTKQ